MPAAKSIYKVLRSLLFAASLTAVALVLLLYVAVALPPVQKELKRIAEKELSSLLGGRVSVSSVEIRPFNEVRVYGVSVHEPSGPECILIDKLGVGFRFLPLISDGIFEFSYVELIGLDARISQRVKDGPLNVSFIIDALSGKDKDKPASDYKVVLHNVVVRKSSISFDREYLPRLTDTKMVDFNHLQISNLRADIALPLISNDEYDVELHRLAFSEQSGLSVNMLRFRSHISPRDISLADFRLEVGNSMFSLNDMKLEFDGYENIPDAVKRGSHSLALSASPLFLSDLAPFYSRLSEFVSPFEFELSASGNANDFTIERFLLDDTRGSCHIDAVVSANDFLEHSMRSLNADALEARFSSGFISAVCDMIPALDTRVRDWLFRLGSLELAASAQFHKGLTAVRGSILLGTGAGALDASGEFGWGDGRFFANDFSIKSDSFEIGGVSGIDCLGAVALSAAGNISVEGGRPRGDVDVTVPFVDYRNHRFTNILVEASGDSGNVDCDFSIDDPMASLSAKASCSLAGTDSKWNLSARVAGLHPYYAGFVRMSPSESVSADLECNLFGNSVDNIYGSALLSGLSIAGPKKFELDRLHVSADVDGDSRSYDIESDFMTASLNGLFKFNDMAALVQSMLHETVPTFINAPREVDVSGQHASFHAEINPDDSFYALLGLPVRPGVPVMVDAVADGNDSTVSVNLDAPYLIQGRDKLVRNVGVDVLMTHDAPAKVRAAARIPVKNDLADLSIDVDAFDGSAEVDVEWKAVAVPDNSGIVKIKTDVYKDPLSGSVNVAALLHDSGFTLNNEDWSISDSRLEYVDKSLEVNGLRIGNGPQFININGKASSDPLDVIIADLAGIDLEYVFNILNINYVDFGGIATGTAMASNIFSSSPVAGTKDLFVKNLAYNGCVLGDGQLEGYWDNEKKMVGINADISGSDDSAATVRGGVYVARDSLAFDFGARKIDIRFLQPFMSGFTSSVEGRASGNVKLYGTFSDIDLGGAAFADTIVMKVDYTNVFYGGSDSIFFSPGRIDIPHITLYDRYGKSCRMTGQVRHDFLHNPTFDFEMSGAKGLLVYDTDASINPVWYGRVFANGGAKLTGRTGVVSLDINMATADKSEFTFVLDETQTAEDYTFLTFSDRRKEQMLIEQKTVLTFEDRFKKKIEEEQWTRPDLFVLDLSLDINPDARLVIVMDPKAGDKIRANGSGALRMHYDSNSDDFSLYGKYTLDQGDYNFSLQDLILKNFKIRPGSSISFNGDPLAGMLDIVASYRVNTNLTDLDPSFASDPDLNRTSVPVDALLEVSGDIHAPEIRFDLSLPTVTSDVERKVRSIVSTEDMMNRQVIYLLALNRFYTPEYMGAEQGGEFASVASSTISSQLQNIIGSMTDRFSVAPSFKSEKSDLSDMEFDVALSSSLFDNRLLLNGNLGYRDKTTSQTTFIGDFDLEYLLSRDGKLRLKAYNHFNDASYYLKSALTTQGIGIVYRKEFDDPLSFIKRLMRKKKKNPVSTKGESTKNDK